MHLAHAALRGFVSLALVSAFAGIGSAASNRVPLVGLGSATLNGVPSVHGEIGGIISVDPGTVVCSQPVTFAEIPGGETPGTNYDGVVFSGGMLFAERFAGQSAGFFGDYDLIGGAPSNPLMPQVGAAGANLNVFDYAGNALNGLGPLGFPDMDAIGEGSISMLFPAPLSRVKLDLVGGNGGTATLGFYRADGSLIDNVVVGVSGDLTYAFATFDNAPAIAGILIQNTDASGVGVDNICHNAGPVSTRAMNWGRLKQLYR